jgi:hypothetical protein
MGFFHNEYGGSDWQQEIAVDPSIGGNGIQMLSRRSLGD